MTIAHELMTMLNDCDASEAAKAEFRKLIREAAARNGAIPSQDLRLQRVEFARHLLRDLREPRTIIRSRLMDQFAVSRSQAYVDISDALKLSSPRHLPLDALGK